jgi:hypothetical protein
MFNVLFIYFFSKQMMGLRASHSFKNVECLCNRNFIPDR